MHILSLCSPATVYYIPYKCDCYTYVNFGCRCKTKIKKYIINFNSQYKPKINQKFILHTFCSLPVIFCCILFNRLSKHIGPQFPDGWACPQ